MNARQVGVAVVVLGLALVAMSAQAQQIMPGTLSGSLRLVGTVTSSSNGGPTFGVHAGDPRFLYVGQQNGAIRIFDFNQPAPLLPSTVFLNIDAALGAGVLLDDTNIGERGLLGAAFHPDFNNAANPAGYRKFYTFTSENAVVPPPPPRATLPPNFAHQSESFTPNHYSVIREWTAAAPDPQGLTMIDAAIPSRIVMQIAKPGQFHNGGALAFGPDNYLYISTGDGGVRNDGDNGASLTDGHTNSGNPDTPGGYVGHGNAQDRRNVYGKILRIKPTTDADPDTIPSTAGSGWRVPKSNPFTADANAATPVPGWQDTWVDEIYAYGFRNPFRMSFDEATGDLFASDVGQDRGSSAREEVNRIVSGGNYGWIIRAGDVPYAPFNYPVPVGTTLINPVAQYRTLAGNPASNPSQPGGTGGLAAIGGYVYRGEALPALDGKYIFADLNRGDGSGGRLLYADVTGASPNPVFDLTITGATQKPGGAFIHGMAEDADGEIYFLFGNGQVMKLVPEPGAMGIAIAAMTALAGIRQRRR
jgi:glucose/arabinose dehydrogenase